MSEIFHFLSNKHEEIPEKEMLHGISTWLKANAEFFENKNLAIAAYLLENKLHMEVDKDRCGGRPTITGTRFTASQLLSELLHRSGETIAKDFKIDYKEIEELLNSLSVAFNEKFT